MTVQAFLQAVGAICGEKPSYRIGGDGSDGTCDCVGLLMGAIRRCGPSSFPLHSSNYFARWRIDKPVPAEQAALAPGMAVIKARADTGQLNSRYKAGGSFCNGDPLDYYHIGVVLSISPLKIVHCTSGGGANGIVTDTRLTGWTHAGRILDIEEEPDMTRTAAVSTPDGNPLKLRPSPDTDHPPVARIPNGSTVTVLADAQGWAKTVWQGQTGYCMSRFLTYGDPAAPGLQPVLERLDTIIALLGGGADG